VIASVFALLTEVSRQRCHSNSMQSNQSACLNVLIEFWPSHCHWCVMGRERETVPGMREGRLPPAPMLVLRPQFKMAAFPSKSENLHSGQGV
jgi:hypothetical protein